MVLLVIPRSFQIYDWELQRWLDSFELSRDQLDLDRPQRILGAWGQTRGVRVLDLLDDFRIHQDRHPDERLYFFPNGHMNGNGNRVAADALADTLRDVLLPAPGDGPDLR